jgi:hypothetical protein
MFQRIALATLGVSVTLFAGCASTESKKTATPATITVVNTICPIAGDDFARHEMPADLTREWKGTKIGFCCEHCVPKFDKLTTAEKDNVRSLALVNKALVNPEE